MNIPKQSVLFLAQIMVSGLISMAPVEASPEKCNDLLSVVRQRVNLILSQESRVVLVKSMDRESRGYRAVSTSENAGFIDAVVTDDWLQVRSYALDNPLLGAPLLARILAEEPGVVRISFLLSDHKEYDVFYNAYHELVQKQFSERVKNDAFVSGPSTQRVVPRNNPYYRRHLARLKKGYEPTAIELKAVRETNPYLWAAALGFAKIDLEGTRFDHYDEFVNLTTEIGLD